MKTHFFTFLALGLSQAAFAQSAAAPKAPPTKPAQLLLPSLADEEEFDAGDSSTTPLSTAEQRAQRAALLAGRGLWNGAKPLYKGKSARDPRDIGVAFRVSLQTPGNPNDYTTNRYFTPSRAARTVAIHSADLDAALRAPGWDGLTEIFPEQGSYLTFRGASQIGFQTRAKIFDFNRDEMVTRPGIVDPFEAYRESDWTTALVDAPQSPATLSAVTSIGELPNYGPNEVKQISKRAQTIRKNLLALKERGHPDAARQEAILEARLALGFTLGKSPEAPNHYRIMEETALPLLKAAKPSPLTGKATPLTELALWRMAAVGAVSALYGADPTNAQTGAANDARLDAAATQFPDVMIPVAMGVYFQSVSANSAFAAKWLDWAEKSAKAGGKVTPTLQFLRLEKLKYGSDERFAALSALAWDLPDSRLRVGTMLNLSSEAQRRKQFPLAKRALETALDEGAPHRNWLDLAALDFSMGHWEDAYRANQIAMQVKVTSGNISIDDDRSPAAELGRWLEFRNALLLAILQKDVMLKPGTTAKGKVPQSEALNAAFEAFNFGKPGDKTPLLRAAQAQIEGFIARMPANKSLPIALARVKWAIQNQS